MTASLGVVAQTAPGERAWRLSPEAFAIGWGDVRRRGGTGWPEMWW